MPIATGLAIGLGVASAAGSIGGAALSAHAAGKAADAQSAAAQQAAHCSTRMLKEALAFQKKQYSDQQKNMAPWLQAGKTDLATLQGQLPSLTAPFTEKFKAPTAATEQNDPGYQFRLQQGMKALQNSASARGDLLSGNTLAATTQYGQDYASGEYGNVYNRAMQEYQNRFNVYNANQTNKFNRLASLSGVGQTSAQQLGQSGQAAANNISNTLLTSGQQIGQNMNNAAAATASGYIGAGNAWGGAVSGIGNNVLDLYMLNKMGMFKSGSNPTTGGA
jgi:hypothetical protein